MIKQSLSWNQKCPCKVVAEYFYGDMVAMLHVTYAPVVKQKMCILMKKRKNPRVRMFFGIKHNNRKPIFS